MWGSVQLEEELERLGMGGAWEAHVLPRIRRVTAAAMRSAQERAEPRRGSFEIYGLDFVLGEDALVPQLHLYNNISIYLLISLSRSLSLSLSLSIFRYIY